MIYYDENCTPIYEPLSVLLISLKLHNMANRRRHRIHKCHVGAHSLISFSHVTDGLYGVYQYKYIIYRYTVRGVNDNYRVNLRPIFINPTFII